jgi:hypothetical protein
MTLFRGKGCVKFFYGPLLWRFLGPSPVRTLIPQTLDPGLDLLSGRGSHKDPDSTWTALTRAHHEEA